MQPQFRCGDRVRVTGVFDAPPEGALGRVDDLIRVDIGNGAVAYDVTVLLEEPVDVWGNGELQTRFTHSAHNFEHIDEPPQGKGKGGKGGEPFAGKGKGKGFGFCFHCGGGLEIAIDGLPIAHEECQMAAGLFVDNPVPPKGKGGKGNGCTKYSKKRRLLREHRRNMRVMDDVIRDHGLAEELEDRMVEETGNSNFWLGHQSEMDEDSDQEDPEAVAKQRANDLLQESKDKQAFVTAAQDALACRALAQDLERARMQLEDLRAHKTNLRFVEKNEVLFLSR